MTDPLCRPRVHSTWYPWPDSPADYHWRCPLHGPRWRLPVKSCNNAIESFTTLSEAVDDAMAHVKANREDYPGMVLYDPEEQS